MNNILCNKKILILYLFLFIIILLVLICYVNDKTLYEIIHPNDFSILFPDYKFKCKKNCDKYNKTISYGFKKMKEKNIVICGLSQNMGSILNKFILRIESLSKYFNNLKVIIFENDSTDNTRNKLLEWEKKNKNIYIIKCSENEQCKLNEISAINHGLFSKNRFKKMINYRNKLLEHLFKLYPHYDYCMMIDTDLRGPFSINGIAHSIGIQDEINWDSISSYGLTTLGFFFTYYDLMAYKDLEDNEGIPNNNIKKIKLLLELSNKEIGDDPIKVKSAFAGFAIYNIKSINNSNYNGENRCEHLNLHENMIKNGYDNIYINPNMVVLSGLQSYYRKYLLF